MRSLALIACLAACSSEGTGSLELTLTLPTDPDLRPAGMTTVTVTATEPGGPPMSTTSVLVDGRFSAGDIPIGADVQIGVVLRDVSNRIVGVGQAGHPVDIVGDQPTQLAIPVRRPFVYASSGSALVSFDPTLDPRDPRFQGTLAGITAPRFTISVGGDRLAVVTDSQVHVVETATNAIRGMIPVPAGTRDAAAVPGTAKLAVAHAAGITIVDLDTSTAVTADVGPVDRVTVGPGGDGALVAYGLVARVAPPDLPPPMGACDGSSSLVRVAIDSAAASAPIELGEAVSDLAAAPDGGLVFATLPCAGQVARLASDIDIAGVTLEKVSDLERASALSVQGDRIYAAGTATATPYCGTTACNASTQVACPATQSNAAIYASEGARLVVQSISFDGERPIVLEIPGRRETIIDIEDDARQHAQVLKAMGAVPIDLVTLPGGQYLAVQMESRYYIASLTSGFETLLPCLDVSTSDWLLVDLASASIAQRVRTYCNVDAVGQPAIFSDWDCDLPPEGERNALPLDYQPGSLGALFGAR